MKSCLTYFSAAIAVAGITFSSVSQAEITERYDSLVELIHAHADYDESNNTFELFSEEPLAFRLSKFSIRGEPEEVTYYENWRAAIYGIYNTFAHTDIDAVSVTAIPFWQPSFTNREGERLLEDRAITLEMDRSDALEALQAVTEIESLADAKTMTDFGYQWGPTFLDVYYEDRDPGLDVFIQELREHCVGPCD